MGREVSKTYKRYSRDTDIVGGIGLVIIFIALGITLTEVDSKDGPVISMVNVADSTTPDDASLLLTEERAEHVKMDKRMTELRNDLSREKAITRNWEAAKRLGWKKEQLRAAVKAASTWDLDKWDVSKATKPTSTKAGE